MLEVQKAAFSFEAFSVPKLSYQAENSQGDELSIGFDPSGLYNLNNGEFKLFLNVIIRDKNIPGKLVFDLSSVAIFKISPIVLFEEIPSYFYKNSIAIMFPYIRSFISTITLQANIKLLNLHLMNLSELETPLKLNTSILKIED
jgi:preprotein translocase subunit SecB